MPTLSGESARWAEALAAEPERAAGAAFCGVQFPGIDRMDYLALHPQARVEAYFMSPALRAGRVDLMALDYLGIARHFTHGPAPDVAVAQLTPPDADGWCSPGLSCDFLPLVWRRARRRAAHLHLHPPGPDAAPAGAGGRIMTALRSWLFVPADLLRLSHMLDVLEARAGLATGAGRIIPVAAERPEAMLQMRSMAGLAMPRLAAFTWGAEDLSAAIGAIANRDADGAYAPR